MYRHLKTSSLRLLVVAAVIALPSVALANAGTPLMWAPLLHMFIGNACIGMLEGVLLARVYRVLSERAIGLMILANYFSAWFGWTSLSHLQDVRAVLDLYNVRWVLWGMVAAAYVATLVLEWPFVVGCLWGTEKKLLRRSFGACLLVQSVSCVLLFGWYGLASVNSLLTDLTIVPLDQISLPADVCVYYIADEDGDVYSRQFSAGQSRKVYDLKSRDFADCLSFEAAPSTRAAEGFHEIVAVLDARNDNKPNTVAINVLVRDEDCPLSENQRSQIFDRYPSPSRGTASKLGSAFHSPWTLNAGFWPVQGLSGANAATGEHIRCALEVPFVQWHVRRAILLPADRVLFQLGKRQICILDLKTRKVAVLCFGRGAIAIIEHHGPLTESE